jgi:glycosyltransferase involved in cell wall biosynthesis
MAKVAGQIPAKLWIYGSGDYLPDALALARRLGLGDKVHFSGSFFPVEQIPEMVSGMDLGIVGNRRNLACDKYMLPVKLLEYVYLGIPVVVPRLSIIARYFNDTMVRFYEPENEDEMAAAIVELFHDKDRRKLLATNAQQFYQTYNIGVQASRYINVLTGSVAKRVANAARERA